MDDTSRKAIVDALKNQTPSKPAHRRVQFHEQNDAETVTDTVEDPVLEEEERMVNNAASSSKTARQSSKAGTNIHDAHPGDPRRMLSTPKKDTTPGARQVKTVQRRVMSASRHDEPPLRHHSDDNSDDEGPPPLGFPNQDVSSSESDDDADLPPCQPPITSLFE